MSRCCILTKLKPLTFIQSSQYNMGIINQFLSQTPYAPAKNAYCICLVLNSIFYCLFKLVWLGTSPIHPEQSSCSRAQHLSAICFRPVLKSAVQSISITSLKLKKNLHLVADKALTTGL